MTRPKRRPATPRERLVRARWAFARAQDERSVLLEFRESPDVEPVKAIVDEQPGHVGLVLLVAQKATSTWVRHSDERHLARVRLPFDLAGRPLRDVKPLRPPGVTVPAEHHADPDRVATVPSLG